MDPNQFNKAFILAVSNQRNQSQNRAAELEAMVSVLNAQVQNLNTQIEDLKAKLAAMDEPETPEFTPGPEGDLQ